MFSRNFQFYTFICYIFDVLPIFLFFIFIVGLPIFSLLFPPLFSGDGKANAKPALGQLSGLGKPASGFRPA